MSRVSGAIGWALLFVLPLVALYVVFMVVPNERVMGPIQRIFYFHVGSAMTAFLSFFVVMVASIGYLVRGTPVWDRLAVGATEVGVMFLTIVLTTGPLWARPVWGVYWVWQDARLVTTLVLWIYFVIYLLLRSNWGGDPQGMRFAAVMGIVGFLDVPIIYFSVKWWNFMHPSHVMGPLGGGLDATMGKALLLSFLAIFTIWFGLVRTRMNLERSRDRLSRIRRTMGRDHDVVAREV